nr:reverse transcriptase domain-containing protein [Tanacetum cinerariifolium]
MNTTSTSGSGPLPSNTIANPKGEVIAITTRSGPVLYGPFVPIPPPFINPEEDEREEETLMDPELAEYTIKFTFPADFVIVDYESDPRVSLILGRPFLRTAQALIDVYGEQMILLDGDERLTLNMRHDTSSYSNQPQKESSNMINIFNDSCEDSLKDLFATNHQSGNPTFSSHPNLTSPEVKDDIFDPEGDMVLIEKLINLDYTKDLPPPRNINPLNGSTTSSSPNHLLEEDIFLTMILSRKWIPFSRIRLLKEILLILMSIFLIPFLRYSDEHSHDYSSPPLYDEYDDDLFKVESDAEYVYNDPFDSKEDEINKSKLLIDELGPVRSSDFLPSPEYDTFLFKDFSKVDALPSTNNEDKVFNPGILTQENLFEVITRVAPDKNVKKISNASLILDDFNPPLYELPFHKEVP